MSRHLVVRIGAIAFLLVIVALVAAYRNERRQAELMGGEKVDNVDPAESAEIGIQPVSSAPPWHLPHIRTEEELSHYPGPRPNLPGGHGGGGKGPIPTLPKEVAERFQLGGNHIDGGVGRAIRFDDLFSDASPE